MLHWILETLRSRPAIRPLERADLTRSGTLIVHCWASWNRHDIEFTRRFADAAAASRTSQYCRSHDVETPEWTSDLEHWRVTNVPALVRLRDGQHVETIFGVRPVAELEKLLMRWTDESRRPSK